MNFCLNIAVHFNAQKFNGVLEQLSFTPKFWGKICKNRLSVKKTKMVLIVEFMKLKCRWL